MKKIKILFTSLLFILIAASCDKDGGTSVRELSQGATPNIKKIASTDQAINLTALNNNQNINLGLTVGVGMGDVSSMNVVGYFIRTGSVEKGILKANITSFPATVNITQADIYAAFTTVNSAADISITDKLLVSTDITLTDGRVIKMFNDQGVQNFGADVANSQQFTSSQTYVISCPLTDASNFNGNYKVTKDDWQDYAIGDIVPVVYNAANGTLKFRIMSTNNPFLVNTTTSYMEVTIDPATSDATVVSNEPFNYGGANVFGVTGSGTVGSCTGDINLTLSFSGIGGTFGFNLVKQ